jgi:hypothetical protein
MNIGRLTILTELCVKNSVQFSGKESNVILLFADKLLEQQQKEIEDRDEVINRECQWYLDLNELENTFIASCNNNGFLLYEGSLKDNNMNCCPYCGGKIKELLNIEGEL